MPLIAPDQGPNLSAAGLVPPAFQDPSLFVPSPVSQLTQAQAAGHLSQLNDQLALEKAQRQADMAATNFRIAATQNLQKNLGLMNQADIAKAYADISAYGRTTAENTNATTYAGALAQAKQPQAAADVTAAQTTNALATAKADAGFAALPNPYQAGLLAQSQAYGGFLGSRNVPPAIPAAPTAPAATPAATPAGVTAKPVSPDLSNATATPAAAAAAPSNVFGVTPATNSFLNSMVQSQFLDAVSDKSEVEEQDPQNPGIINKYLVRTAKDGSGVMSKTLIGTTKADAFRTVQSAQKDMENLASTQALVNNAFQSIDNFQKAFPAHEGLLSSIKNIAGRFAQSLAASASTQEDDHKVVSTLERALGPLAETSETKTLTQSLQNLNQAVVRLDGESQKGVSKYIPTTADITDPDMLKVKLNGLQDYLNSRINAYQQAGALGKMNPGLTPTAPGGAATSVAPAKLSKYNDGPGVYDGKKGQFITDPATGRQYFSYDK